MQIPLSEMQKKVLDTFLKTGSKLGTATKLGLDRSTVRNHLKRIEAKGHAPWLSPAGVPDHLKMTKTTVQYDAAGNVTQEWKRLTPDLDAMREFVAGLCEQVKGKAKVPVRKPLKHDSKDILFELDLYDAHVGMYADEKETLDKDYDCDIAARRMLEAARALIGRTNRPHKSILVFGGDMIHSDTRSNTTEKSGNVLDVDTRWHRVIRYLRTACQDVVNELAQVSGEVEVIVLKGNHGWHSEAWLSEVLDAYFHDCPNVTVNQGQSERRCLVWGENMLVWAHGDSIPLNKWPMIIPAEFPKQWGATTNRHLKLGHVHRKRALAPVVVDEQTGLLVEHLEALCPSDAWHSSKGYIGTQRGASAFEYHRDKGLYSRFYHTF